MLKRSRTDGGSPFGADTAILVVNDDADGCELISRIIESAGAKAIRHTDLATVASTLETFVVAAVVIDSIHCGIETAFEVLAAVRSVPEAASVAAVVLAPSDTNRLYAFQSGADGYLVRPFHAHELLDELADVLERSPAERDEYRETQLLGGTAI